MKVLEFIRVSDLAPKGGPAGYLYNLFSFKNRIDDEDILFLPVPNSITKLEEKIYFKIRKSIGYIKDILNQRLPIHNFELYDYDIVHFHSSLDMYSQKKKLDTFSGIVIFTSHSPKVSFKEFKEDIFTADEVAKNENMFCDLEYIDKYAFKRADYIIFPCPGAEEPYYHSWPKYAELRDEKKIRYIPTGILPVECKKTREEIRNELSIPQDAIVLSFVGRHNEVKGYDILQSIFSKLENVYVVCCGKIGNILPPKSDRWI